MARLYLLQDLTGILGGIIASKKGRNPLLWGALCFIFPLMLLAIGIMPAVVRSGRTKQCPYCNKVISESDTHCRFCGKEMPINLIKCNSCGSYVPDR